MFTTSMKFEHQMSSGTYHSYGLRQKDSIVFIVQRQILSENCQKRALCADRRLLRRDTIASRFQFQEHANI